MHIAHSVANARASLDALPRPLGFVPTMGALHDGHLALVRRARSECSSVAASVFVNPLQFAPGEDLSKYPRDLEGDKAKLAAVGVDVLFAPTHEAMYPPGFSTSVDVGLIGSTYEGAIRPQHFRGVTTVMAKLLAIVLPDVLYLGQKDAQQTVVLHRMVQDLNFAVRFEIVPTVREGDGLALSSRNVYLSDEQRAAAPTLYRALTTFREALEQGKEKTAALALARSTLSPLAVPDYFDVVDARTFEPLEKLTAPAFVIGAARFDGTRLLDNVYLP